jgi:excisionase family DNA binding protein
MDTQLIKIEDVMKRLLISRQSVHNYIKDGKLRPVKLGRLIRFDPADIEKLINESKDNNRATA